MQYAGGKQKSFLQNFTWTGVMLLTMGLVFLSVAVVMQLVPMSPESITAYRNGIRQPSTEQTVRTFRLIFLLTFGVTGLGLAVAGGIVAGRAGARRRLTRRLKEDGLHLVAEAMDCSPSAVHVNRRYLQRLRCSCKGADGITYIFKSGLLRMDPTPYLDQNRVNVYHDRDNMSRYVVDVDGSAGMNSRVVEL